MRKIIFLSLFAMVATVGFGQEDEAVTKKLKQKYHFVVYQNRDGGWYSIFTSSYGCKACAGAADIKGNEIVPCKYDNVIKTRSGYFSVELNGKKGARNLQGNEIVPCKYDEIVLQIGYFSVELNGKKGIWDLQGNEIVPCKYARVKMYKKNNWGYAQAAMDKTDKWVTDKWAIFTLDGKQITGFEYTEILAQYKDDKMFYFVNRDGIVDGRNDEENYLTGGKWGIVNEMGKEIISCKYDGIGWIAEGLIPINIGGTFDWIGKSIGGKWGYIDLNGKVVFEPVYESAESFESGVAKVTLNGKNQFLENPLHTGNKNIGGVISFNNSVSDVDQNIPENAKNQNNETFAFIFANEHYPNLTVPFALNDGKIFKEYCIKTLSIPESNIRFYENATIGNMRSAINKIKEFADAYDGDARFIVYYSGQGMTDDNTKTTYLLPVDAVLTSLSATGYSVEKLNQELSEISAKSTLLILDASFNGSSREGKMLTAARGVAVKAKPNYAEGSLIILSAGSENTYQHKDKNHGLFTYYLLKKIQETKGNITYKELSDYVISEVKKQSVGNAQMQLPTIVVSDKLTSWQTLKIK